jgi:putative restriction endonuclease
MTLTPKQLNEKLIHVVYECGWQVNYLSLKGEKPIRMVIYSGDKYYSLIIYIRNVTHGGASRDSKEYRIQIHERNSLITEPDSLTLILGWWDDQELLVGWDVKKHTSPSYSSSLQVSYNALLQAYKNGISHYYKEKNNEMVITIKPEFFIHYIENINILHELGSSLVDLDIFEQTVKSTDNKDSSELFDNVTTKEREVTLRLVSMKTREYSFQKRVLNAYNNKCAFCGVQLKLVDAAHIVPVSFKNSTDETANGIALCAIHHRAYDNSLITFTEDYEIQYNPEKFLQLESEKLREGKEKFLENLRKIIVLPPDEILRPKRQYIETANKLRGW